MVFSDHAVRLCPKTHYNVSKHAVIHIHAAFPQDLPWINTESIALLDMVVEKGCQKVIR